MLVPIKTKTLTDAIKNKKRLLNEINGDINHKLYGLYLHICKNIDNYMYNIDPRKLDKINDPIDRLKYLMRKHRIRQIDLSKAGLGNRSTVSSILSGRKLISKRQCIVLSDYFNCSPDVFFQYEYTKGPFRGGKDLLDEVPPLTSERK